MHNLIRRNVALFCGKLPFVFKTSSNLNDFSAFSNLGTFLPNKVRWNSNRAAINKIGRPTYTRMYPTMVVQPDGSTINIRYKEPRRIITLPFDMSTLTEEEQRLRMLKRRPKLVVKVEEEIDDGFDAGRYLPSKKKKQ